MLQETVWTEADVARHTTERAATLRALGQPPATWQEPVFCFETVMKVRPSGRDKSTKHLVLSGLLRQAR